MAERVLATDPQDDAYEVIVVGSGLGGLSAASLMAKAGKRVLVIERGDGPGGLAHAFRRGDYLFDSAIRVTAEGEFLDSVLGHLGVRDHVRMLPIDRLYRAIFPGFSIDAPSGFDAFVEEHVRHFPGSEAGIRSFFGLRSRIFEEAAQMPHQISVKDLGRAMDRFPTLFRYRTATVQAVLEEHIPDARARAVCSAMWPYVVSPPSRVSFLAFSQLLGIFVDGPLYCQGSFQRLADAFVAGLEAHGGELVVGRKVDRIDVADGAVRGVALEGGRMVRAPIVVSNVDARQTFERLVGLEHIPTPFLRRLHRLQPSMSAVMIYAAVAEDACDFDLSHERFLYRHWDHEATYRDIVAGRPGAMQLNVQTLSDRSLAPPGQHLVVLGTVAPYDVGRPWSEVKDQYADEVLRAFDAHYPGLYDGLQFMQVGTPVTVERFTGNHRGAANGWELRPNQITSKRLPHRTGVDGLYLSGHWTHEGPGSFRVIQSGVQTAQMVAADAGLDGAVPDFRPSDFVPLAF